MNITPQDLLDAGVHFGHQTRRWNPKSKPYIYSHIQGISIIDLEKTFALLGKAAEYLTQTVANGGQVLFVGTKRQARDIVKEAATASTMPFCVNRWLGGTLTNFETVKRSLARYKKLQGMETDGSLAKMHKKEAAVLKRDMARMQRNFEGILESSDLPAALFVVDTKSEAIAVAEANRCGIPVVGLVDTNSDPSLLKYPIPGNDDAEKSIRIIVNTVVEAVQAGLQQREARRAAAKAAEPRFRVAATPVGPQDQPGAAEGVSYNLPASMKDLDFKEEPAAEGAAGVKKPVRRPRRAPTAAPKSAEEKAPEAAS